MPFWNARSKLQQLYEQQAQQQPWNCNCNCRKPNRNPHNCKRQIHRHTRTTGTCIDLCTHMLLVSPLVAVAAGVYINYLYSICCFRLDYLHGTPTSTRTMYEWIDVRMNAQRRQQQQQQQQQCHLLQWVLVAVFECRNSVACQQYWQSKVFELVFQKKKENKSNFNWSDKA